MPTMSSEWRGRELEMRVRRASGRAIVAIAVNVAIETKQLTHKKWGTLARSTHAAPVGYEGAGDEARATGGEDMLGMDTQAVPTPEGQAVEVGSWLPYACAEWVGRGHPGVTQGLEVVRGAHTDGIVAAAFRAEGL